MEQNKYYNIRTGGPEAVRFAATLLQSYPVTRACYGILGDRLLSQIQYGFFTEKYDIIIQDDIGKDLYMLCDDVIEVMVDGQKVVDMEAPALFGDKGIVEPESKRAATIRVAKGKICFFLKIPMGLFIRDFSKMDVPDYLFSQEIGIFFSMFKGIQNRLFEYAYIQKNLWEEVNTTLKIKNAQQIIRALDNRVDLGWELEVWNVIRNHLEKDVKFTWPSEVPLDITTFRNFLRQHLDETFPRESFKGQDADYIKKKHLLWRKWLTSTAKVITKELPEEKLPVHIKDIELFNPRNYQLRIQGLVKAIEKRFLKSKSRDPKSTDKNSEEKDQGIKSFFGRSDKDNFFDLKSYLNSFEAKFDMKYPKRMQTQIAQKTALVAAKCENEFNESVAAMKRFLDDAQVTATKSYIVKKGDVDQREIHRRNMLPVNRIVSSYFRHIKDPGTGKIGTTIYKKGASPNIPKLFKACATPSLRDQLDIALRQLLKSLNISSKLLPTLFIKKNFFFCEASPGFELPNEELERNYWVPLSHGFRLYSGKRDFGKIEPGRIIGGKGWVNPASDLGTQKTGKWSIKAPKRKPKDPINLNYVLLSFPAQEIPWENNASPDQESFEKIYLPAMQWLINKQIEHILSLLPQRDEIYHNWLQTEQIVKHDTKVTEFEETVVQMSVQEQAKIRGLLSNVIGLDLEKGKALNSKQLSKKIYNHILKQMGKDYAGVSIEALGNRTYTKWRLVLSEIIQIMEEKDEDKIAQTATPVFDIIETELLTIMKSFGISNKEKPIKLVGQSPYIRLPQVLESLKDPEQDRMLLFQLILSTLETYLRLLIEEIYLYQQKFDEAYTKRPKTDVQALQVKSILETADKLKSIVSEPSEAEQQAETAETEQ